MSVRAGRTRGVSAKSTFARELPALRVFAGYTIPSRIATVAEILVTITSILTFVLPIAIGALHKQFKEEGKPRLGRPISPDEYETIRGN